MVNPLIGFGIPNWTWDILALLTSLLLILTLIRLTTMLYRRERISLTVAQNTTQIFAGPLFVASWLLFTGDFYSRYFAGIIPALFIIYSFSIFLGISKDEGFLRIMSRDGEKVDILKAPLFYFLVMLIAALILWYVPLDLTATPLFSLFIPTAILIFGPLAGGKGFSNIIGHRYGRHKFKVFTEKSVESTLAMFGFGLIFTLVILGIYWIILEPAYASIQPIALIIPIFITSVVATITEVLCPRHTDNVLIPITIFFTLVILALVGLFPYYVVFPLRSPF